MARAGLQKRVLICKRCGQAYTHTNQMERRRCTLSCPRGGWDALEGRWFNTHTLACAKAKKEEVR